MDDKNLNWQKILWASVLIFGIVLVTYIRFVRSNTILGFGIYPYIMWPYVTGISVLVAILRFLKLVPPTSFIYILIALANAVQGFAGMYLNVTSAEKISFWAYGMFLLNFIFAWVFFQDVFSHRVQKGKE